MTIALYLYGLLAKIHNPGLTLPGTDGFTDEFYQTAVKEIITISQKFLQKIEEERILSISFYETLLAPNRKRHYRKRKL